MSEETLFCNQCDSACTLNPVGRSRCCDEEVSYLDRPFVRPDLSDGRRPKTSRFFGVYRFKGRWRAQFRRCGLTYWLGDYEHEEVAAEVYDNAVYYLSKEPGGFFRRPKRLNREKTYADPENCPPPWKRTQEVIAHWRAMCRFAGHLK